jgi:predicted enzyme related to lactoylglutathione lyase
VNEPGAWSMSRLDTPDVEAAKAFYGSVFGWTTESFADKGVGEITLFRLPGYVGGEPEQPVSREVIAAMAPGNAGGKARWSVDFWVGDIDTAAGAAEPAGGTVVMAPFETPLGRSAVLADPAGVTFSISQVKRDR